MMHFENNLIQGVVVALVTPFNAEGQLDERAWEAIIDWHLSAGTHGLVVGGTTGESASLTRSERDRMLSMAVERCAGKIPVLAGTGSASTAQTIEDSQRAAELGADAVLVVTPYYNRPPQAGLLAHYRAVADASPAPVMLYNVPSRTACDLSAETSIALCQHDNILGIKEAFADLERIQSLVTARVLVLSGDDPTALDAVRHGAQGVISVIANIVPGAMVQLFEFAQAGNYEQAEQLQRELKPLLDFLSIQTNPIPAKWLLAEMGMMNHAIRLPLVGLDAQHVAAGKTLLDRLQSQGLIEKPQQNQQATPTI